LLSKWKLQIRSIPLSDFTSEEISGGQTLALFIIEKENKKKN
jgi:hypothetical protein